MENKAPTDNLELFYDCLDETVIILYEAFTKYHKAYFDLLFMTMENIIAGEVKCDCDKETEEKLNKAYDKISDIDFSVEDVRKAVQAIILKGFKEMRLPNGNTTPDTIGMLVAYIISKVFDKKDLNILDPLCGTGNLLFTICNHLSNNIKLLGCDHDPFMTKLTSLTAELLHQDIELFMQETTSLRINNIDVITFDLPNILDKVDEYLPYKWILHYTSLLNDDGLIIAVVPNDFFDHDNKKTFRKELLKTMSILGFIELPDDMFVSKPKCILVLQKVILKDNKCFMVKLPGFNNVKEFNDSLFQIEQWFDKYKYNKKSEEEV